MNESDKKIGEKVVRVLEFIKKEFPCCYKKMQKCCMEDDCGSKE